MDNRREIANYKALTWIKCTLQLVVMEPLNDLLNSLKSPSLCKAIHLSWADIKRKTWFINKQQKKKGRMNVTVTDGKQREKRKNVVVLCVFLSMCTSDIYLCGLSKSNLACCYRVQTNRHCRLKNCCNIQHITQRRSSRWIMSGSHLIVILFKEYDIELTHNPIMAAIQE